MLNMLKYLINHPSHPLSDQNYSKADFQLSLACWKVFVYFPAMCHVPYVDQPSIRHSPVGQPSGGEEDFDQHNRNHFICFAPQWFFTVQTVEERRYCNRSAPNGSRHELYRDGPIGRRRVVQPVFLMLEILGRIVPVEFDIIHVPGSFCYFWTNFYL